MTAVLISYSESDRTAVQAIEASLNSIGITEIRLSSSYNRQYFSAMTAENTACVVVLWSKAASINEYEKILLQHLIYGWSNEKLIIGHLDETPLPIGFRDLPVTVLRGDLSGWSHEIAIKVQFLLNRPPAQQNSGVLQGNPSTLGTGTTRRSRAWPVLALLLAAPCLIALWSAWPSNYNQLNGQVESTLRHTLEESSRRQAEADERTREAISRPAEEIPIERRHEGQNKRYEDPTDGTASPRKVPTASTPPAARVTSILIVLLALFVAFTLIRAALFVNHKQKTTVRTTDHFGGPVTAHQVFISYSRRDKLLVDVIVSAIEESGVSVWIDQRQNESAKRYAEPLVKAIKSANVVAVMCSRNAFKSDHVIREIYVAGDYKKPFMSFLLDASIIPDEVQYFTTGFPRVPIENIDANRIRAELSRFVKIKTKAVREPKSKRSPETGAEMCLQLSPDFGPIRTIRIRHLAGGRQFIVGRHSSCEVVFEHPSVSRQHARIILVDGLGPCISDLGSSSGTLLDGKRVGSRPVPLTGARNLRLGQQQIVVSMRDMTNGALRN